MRITKRLAATLLAFCMIALMIPDALAVTATTTADKTAAGNYDAAVYLTTAATTFKVTVPTAIYLESNANGTVTCPTDVKITNESGAPVKVTGIKMKDHDITNAGWKLTSSTILDTAKVDSKLLYLQMTVGKEGSLDTASTNDSGYSSAKDLTHSTTGDWSSKWIISNDTTSNANVLPITLSAKASPVTESSTGSAQVSTVTFTVGWAYPAD